MATKSQVDLPAIIPHRERTFLDRLWDSRGAQRMISLIQELDPRFDPDDHAREEGLGYYLQEDSMGFNLDGLSVRARVLDDGNLGTVRVGMIWPSGYSDVLGEFAFEQLEPMVRRLHAVVIRLMTREERWRAGPGDQAKVEEMVRARIRATALEG